MKLWLNLSWLRRAPGQKAIFAAFFWQYGSGTLSAVPLSAVLHELLRPFPAGTSLLLAPDGYLLREVLRLHGPTLNALAQVSVVLLGLGLILGLLPLCGLIAAIQAQQPCTTSRWLQQSLLQLPTQARLSALGFVCTAFSLTVGVLLAQFVKLTLLSLPAPPLRDAASLVFHGVGLIPALLLQPILGLSRFVDVPRRVGAIDRLLLAVTLFQDSKRRVLLTYSTLHLCSCGLMLGAEVLSRRAGLGTLLSCAGHAIAIFATVLVRAVWLSTAHAVATSAKSPE